MIYLAYFILAFYSIQFLVALSNFFYIMLLKPMQSTSNALVSILIPARNEENNIGNLLQDLIDQDYKNVEIIVFNDLSTDKTEEIIAQKAVTDSRIKLVNGTGLPEGWLGKNYACDSLAKHAKGTYLLFLDADVRIGNGAISNHLALVEKYKVGLLSIFPKQKMLSLGERLTLPNMNFILVSLLPLALVLKSRIKSMAAANGQFMLFDAAIYRENTPHEKFKKNRVEDIEIARYYKQNEIPVICLLGNDSVECRMYSSYKEAVKGFSKNVISFFGNSFSLAILFWLITTFGIFVILFELGLVFFIVSLVLMIVTRIIISIISKQSIFHNVILIFLHQISMGEFIYKAIVNNIKKQFEWKGRSI